jgi:hypothetical protein
MEEIVIIKSPFIPLFQRGRLKLTLHSYVKSLKKNKYTAKL